MSGVDLVQWLGEQLDGEAEEARAAADGDSGEWFVGDKWNVYRAEDETPHDDVESNQLVVYGNLKPQSEHIAAHDPARVLREIDAKRNVLNAYAAVAENDVNEVEYAHGYANALGEAVRMLALPYSDRPGYEEALASLA